MEFDSRGNLFPAQKITISIEEFYEFFVSKFHNSRREELYNDYLKYIDNFQNLVSPDFCHWIDGSFITRKLLPKDLDFVTLLKVELYEENRNIIEKEFLAQQARIAFPKLDSYIVKVYPYEQQTFWAKNPDLLYWDKQWSTTRYNQNEIKFKKGYIEIKFGNGYE